MSAWEGTPRPHTLPLDVFGVSVVSPPLPSTQIPGYAYAYSKGRVRLRCSVSASVPQAAAALSGQLILYTRVYHYLPSGNGTQGRAASPQIEEEEDAA